MPKTRKVTTARARAATKPVSAKRSTGVVKLVSPAGKRGKARKPRYLVVVESPAKAKTIKKYLGSSYTVKASVGHVKDLPKSRMGVDLEKDFKPEYHVIKGKEKVLAELKRYAKDADEVFLATDPDREGEAIAWHISEEISHPMARRVLFNEITKNAIQKAIAQPTALNKDNYDSQQARRILDRLVGYQISPLLWDKVRRGLSAGRVQSVAVRLVVEREDEIKAFVPQEYWSVEANVEGKNPPPFVAKVARIDGKKAEMTNEGEAREAVDAIRGAALRVASVERKERKKYAPPPFITSKLQQEASSKLRFSPKRTMSLAQRLYEGVEVGEDGLVGLITYMRTDSTRISDDALGEVRAYVGEKYGPTFLPPEPVVYKTKKGAQDAHEAIRPTSLKYDPETVRALWAGGKGGGRDERESDDLLRLYTLIWNRFVACQMVPAVFDQTTIDIAAGRAELRATGQVIKFPGFLSVYAETVEDAVNEDETGASLPDVKEGDEIKLLETKPEQYFTQPPPRFSEATLVKELEEKGIGRPSTYAAILSTIQEKKYVEKIEGRFHPTELGRITTEELVKHFPKEMDVTFTADLEEKLDSISEGEASWKKVLRDFYTPFKKDLARAEREMRDVKREEIKTDLVCERCGSPMVIKWGKMGRFLACTAYPECKNTKDFKEVEGKIVVLEEETTDEKCDKCGRPMVVKRGRFGRFLACSGYPECKNSKAMSIGVACPECRQGYLTQRRSKRGRIFFGCNRYPHCKFASWDRPLPEACPACGSPYLLQKYSKREGSYVACPNPECSYRRNVEQAEGAASVA